MSVQAMALRHIGKPVAVHTRAGAIHYGVLHHVDSQGLFLQRVQPSVPVLGSAKLDVTLLAKMPEDPHVEDVFLPLLFIPLLAASAVYPWYYRPYGYYW